MQDRGTVDHFSEIRSARNGLEAALAVSDSEAARAGWRLYHHALAVRDPRAVRDARMLFHDTVVRSGDEQLIEAKQRYDSALEVEASSTSHEADSVAPGRVRR